MRRFTILLGLFVFLAGSLTVGILEGQSTPIRRLVSHGYRHVRPGGVAADDTALTVSTSAWYDCRNWVEIPEDWDSVSLSVYAYGDGSGGGDPHGAVADANLYVAHEFGSALHVCRFSVEIGQMRLSCDPASGPGSEYNAGGTADANYKWAQGPFALVETFWRSPIGMSGKVDGVGELNFNPNGATKIRVVFDNIADATSFYCVMTGRKR